LGLQPGILEKLLPQPYILHRYYFGITTILSIDNLAVNRALTSSIDPKLLQWESMKIQREAVQKGDGKMPAVMSGKGEGMLFNIPLPAK
jgi:hypothetical protein